MPRGKPGGGEKDAGSNRGLHRIEEILVQKEIEAAGFVIENKSDLLSLTSDNTLSQAWTNPMHETDRFCLLLK